MKISELSLDELVKIQNIISEETKRCTSLEDAAQAYMSILYDGLSESIILARFFATINLENLPEENHKFVSNLAESTGITEFINKKTMVLSLLGSRGKEPEWNDRRKSTGHIGIPLASRDFIDRIPMMSRLLKQLGAGIDWINSNDTQLVARTFKNLSGVFYVKDAKTETDSQNRKIIAAQNFVEEYKVKTVFGIGGCYLGMTMFFTTIIFLRETIEKEMAERFMMQANKFKTSTMPIVEANKIFVVS